MNAEMDFRTKSKKIPLLIVLAVIIIAVVFWYTHSMRVNLKKQAFYAVQQNTEEISNQIFSSIGYAKSSIQLTAQSAVHNMDSEVIDDVNSILNPLIVSTPFNFIEYILADGWNTMNNGGEPFDASNREYYKQGIQGKTGIWVNFSPKKSKEILLNFYTPLYYKGKIAGVFTGTLGGDTNIKPILESNFLGEEIVGFLCDSDGNIISSTIDISGTRGTIHSYLTDVLKVSYASYSMFERNLDNNIKTAFEFKEKSGSAIGCVQRINDAGWYIIQIVPAKSLDNIMNSSTKQSILLIGCIVLLFAFYFSYITWEQKRENEQQKAEYLGIIEVLGKEYSSVYLLDAESGAVTAYRLSGDMKERYGNKLRKGFIWQDGIADYAERFVQADYRQEFINKCSLDNLKEQLPEEGIYFYYEYISELNEERHVYRIIATLLPDSKGKRIVLGVADINEEREKDIVIQKSLQNAYDSAKAANEAKSNFLFNMSHDIRTPMNAILGFTNRLAKCRENEKEFQHCVDKIKISSNYLLNLINNVLDLARIESGKASLDDDYLCDIVEFYENLITVFSEEIKRKNLQFHRTIEVDQHHVLVDITKMEQIFLNILSNAVKYTPNGGEIYLKVAEVPSEREGYCCYETIIEDKGIGMSESFLPHIFDEFSRERNSTESRIIGTGLGMGITKKMIDLMNGTILVESKIGEGTKVTINLCHRIAAESEAISAFKQENSEVEMSMLVGKRILLAEDNVLNTEIAVAVLEEAGCLVEHAENGIACIDMLKHKEAGYYDLILMDIQMPIMDGYKAAAFIRELEDERKSGIPIIAMTANAFEEDKKRALTAGMDAHIAKPIDVRKLFQTIVYLIGGKKDK